MQDSIIILDVVLDRASDTEIAQLCAGLSSGYFGTNASANQSYTFGWGPNGGLTDKIKISVGGIGIMAKFNGSTQKVEAIGACGGASFSDLSVLNQTVLSYNRNGFAFTVQFHLIGGASIEVTVRPGSNTAITAESAGGFA